MMDSGWRRRRGGRNAMLLPRVKRLRQLDLPCWSSDAILDTTLVCFVPRREYLELGTHCCLLLCAF